MNEPEFLTMSSTSASGRPASRGGLLIALLTMLSLGIQQPAAAQDVDLRSLRNPLQDPRGQSPPEMDHVPSDVRDTAGMFSADAVARAGRACEDRANDRRASADRDHRDAQGRDHR